jgi:hypothetical protein
MNPEALDKQSLQPYFEIIRSANEGPKRLIPLTDLIVTYEIATKERAVWLLDFTVKHPLFYDSEHKVTEAKGDSVRSTEYGYEEGRRHRELWHNLGNEAVVNTAYAFADYGYDKVKEIISGLEYHQASDEGTHVKLKTAAMFANIKVKNRLRRLVANDKNLERILGLIVYASEQSISDKDTDLAVFATVVGFAQAYADNIIEKQERGQDKEKIRKQKHTLRDQVLVFALNHYGRGLVDYLAALNGLDEGVFV